MRCHRDLRVHMRKLMLATAILTMAGISPGLARGGHGHGHGHSSGALSAPANPSVPPSLTSDARLTGSAPLPSGHPMTKGDASNPTQVDPEDAKLNEKIKSICRGC
jgi:hypothetical protein